MPVNSLHERMIRSALETIAKDLHSKGKPIKSVVSHFVICQPLLIGSWETAKYSYLAELRFEETGYRLKVRSFNPNPHHDFNTAYQAIKPTQSPTLFVYQNHDHGKYFRPLVTVVSTDDGDALATCLNQVKSLHTQPKPQHRTMMGNV